MSWKFLCINGILFAFILSLFTVLSSSAATADTTQDTSPVLGDVRFMTFNTAPNGKKGKAWNIRVDYCVQIIRSASIDILGVQECGDKQSILERMPEYGSVSECFYRKDRFTINEDERLEHIGAQWAAYIHVTDKRTGQSFYVYNTHYKPYGGKQAAREESSRRIVEHVRNRAKSEDPVVLLGDFNSYDGERGATIRTLKDFGFIDTFRESNRSPPPYPLSPARRQFGV